MTRSLSLLAAAGALLAFAAPSDAQAYDTGVSGYVCMVNHYGAGHHDGAYGAHGVVTVDLTTEAYCRGTSTARLVFLSEGSQYRYVEHDVDTLLALQEMLREAGRDGTLVMSQAYWDGTYYWAETASLYYADWL